jgi:DNA helicase-2/ATP-dependent DNA helicase PcrA
MLNIFYDNMTLKLIKKEESNEESSILKGLNPEQRKAVTTINGPLLIVAGAGSGKTRVLTHRIAYLIEQGIQPYHIIALTFTNKAANQMKQRINNLVGGDVANKVWAGTFHSLFARILRTEAESLGYTNSFSIYDTDDSLSAIKTIMNNMNISQQQYPPQGIRHRISSAKNQMISWKEYRNNADEPIEKMTAMLYEKYEIQLKSSNSMDFDDLLINMIHLLKQNPNILEKYQNKFKYILVDEYQDTNRTQYTAINLLAAKYKNVAVVGDDAQSIYGWRGADIKNILDYQKDYPDATVIRLEQNYRSTKTILAAADSVIKNNRKQLNKTLWTDNPDGDLIELLQCSDDRAEGEDIARKILNMTEKTEYSAKDFAVLYRINAQSQPIENAFRMNNLPYVIIGSISFYKRKEIKDSLAYLRLLNNPQDNESLLRIINEPPRGLGNVTLRHVANYAQDESISLFEAFNQIDLISDIQDRAKKSAKEFIAMVNEFIENQKALTGSELAIKYIERTGLLKMYNEMGTPEAEDKWNNIQQLLSDISSYFRREEEGTLVDYLQQMTLIADIDEKDTTQNQVKLMTLHSAKGLEFPVVFISGLEQGLFPIQRADSLRDETEEERRLFYVGITRAEQKLFLTHARRRMRFGQLSNQSPSAFLREIDQKYLKAKNKSTPSPNTYFDSINSIKPINNITERVEKRAISPGANKIKFSAAALSKKPEPEFDFKMGDIVTHNKFGEGKILALAGTGTNAKAVVHFASVGKKVLLLQYAKLVKV